MSPEPAAQPVVPQLARWSTRLDATDIPAEVLDAATLCIRDTEAVAMAARDLAAVESARRAVAGTGRSSTVHGVCDFSAPAAALIGGTAAHALDFDDWSTAGVVHASAVVWPAALAAAEEADATGADVLAAFIAGVEIIYAIGAAIGTTGYDRRFWTTGILGTIGAAAAAARAGGLTERDTVHAIALGAAQSFGLRDVFGTDAKPFLAGRAAAIGVEAAQAARAGITAPADILESGNAWMRNLACRDGEVAVSVPGSPIWRLIDPGVAFKLYPVCSAAAPAIEAALALRSRHASAVEQITAIHCETTEFVASCLIHARPTSATAAQFCLPFAIATALLDGNVTPASLAPASTTRPALEQLMERLTWAASLPAAPSGSVSEAARVTVRLADGRSLSELVEIARGGPGSPMPMADLDAKFRACCRSAAMSEVATARVHDRLGGLGTLPRARLVRADGYD